MNKEDSLAYVLIYAIVDIAFGWIFNCIWLWLASKWLDVEFSLETATGIWCVLHAVRSTFTKPIKGDY